MNLAVEKIYPLLGEMIVEYEHLFDSIRRLPEVIMITITFENASEGIRKFLIDFAQFNQRRINGEEDAVIYLRSLLKLLASTGLIKCEAKIKGDEWLKELDAIRQERNKLIHSNYIRSPVGSEIQAYHKGRKSRKHSSRLIETFSVDEQKVEKIIKRIKIAKHGYALIMCSLDQPNPPSAP